MYREVLVVQYCGLSRTYCSGDVTVVRTCNQKITDMINNEHIYAVPIYNVTEKYSSHSDPPLLDQRGQSRGGPRGSLPKLGSCLEAFTRTHECVLNKRAWSIYA
jgi:hypothetical protein